ncbi:MAG: hypothetical protein K6T59_15360 [Bryobacteraceae bacterium]|nr:hypothetical protein [Bryobacteraceae bacterium]
MKADCLKTLDEFFSMAKTIDAYTIFSCHKISKILSTEAQLSERWGDFETLSSQEWDDIRASVDDVCAGYLLVYGMRMAFLSVRAKKQIGIWYGVMGIVVDDDILDYRDVLSVATLLYDGALRLEANPAVLFHRGLRHATRKRRELLESFVSAPAFTKLIRSKGFEAIGSGQDFAYRCQTA